MKDGDVTGTAVTCTETEATDIDNAALAAKTHNPAIEAPSE
jgi:hypothetical protein